MARHLFLNTFLTIGIVLATLPGVVRAQPVNELKENPMTSRAQQLMGTRPRNWPN